jgi:ParB-like chromosome segregation protein Spo0J
LSTITAAPKKDTWVKEQAAKVKPGSKLPVTAQRAGEVNVEDWLQSHGVRYAGPMGISLDLIDTKRSRANQARATPLVAESVERFASAMRRGAVFPPIVVFPTQTKVVIIDGNNRHEAAIKVRADTIPGIVISQDTPSELIQLLTVEANARHGVAPDQSWRLQQAMGLTALGFNDEQASAAAGLSLAQIRSYRLAQEADARARSLGVRNFDRLPAGTRVKLGTLRDDVVFASASRLAISSSMTIAEVMDLIKEIKSKGSEAQRLAVVEEATRSRALEAATAKVMGKSTGRVSSPKTSLVSSIGKLALIDPDALRRSILTEHDQALLKQRLKELEEVLLTLQVAVEQAVPASGGSS